MKSDLEEIQKLKEKIQALEDQLEQKQQDYHQLLDQSNQNLQDLFNNANDLITIFRQSGELQFVNDAVKKRLGYSNEEFKELKFLQIVHPDYQKSALQNILRITAGSQFEKFETVLLSRSGKNYYVTGQMTAVFEQEEAVEYRCIFYDITERIRAESAQSLYFQIANITITENDLEQLFQNIFQQLNELLKVNNFHIYSEEKNKYKPLFRVNELNEEATYDLDHALMDYTLERDRSLIIYKEGIQKIAEQKGFLFKDKMPKIWLGVKIQGATETIILSICDYTDQSAYNNQDLELLDYIAGQISLAMERSKKQEKIENQAATLGAIFDSSTHQIWSVNKNFNFTSFNQNYERGFYDYYGIKLRVNTRFEDLVSDKDLLENRDLWVENYAKAFAGNFTNFQTSITTRQGKQIWREVFLNPIFLPNGRIDEISIIANDITDKKEAEQTIIASEEKFRNIFESFQDIYFRCTAEGEISMISPSVQEVLGYSPQEMIGSSALDHLASLRQLHDIKLRLENQDRIRNVEGTLTTKDGVHLQFLFNVRLVKKGKQNIEIEGVARDISQLKETNEQLRKAKETAEKSLKIKERFLANMSHEIRTPMNGIIGMIDLLGSTDMNLEQSEYVKTINKSSQTLLHILNDILDLSKIEAGKMDLRMTPVNLTKMFEKVYELFSHPASIKNNNLFYHIDEQIPKWILADETRLIQILSNLTSNAIKFSKEKGNINLNIKLEKRLEEQLFFKVSVKDSGIGISTEDQATLFQSFHQLDNSSTKNFEGTGLGLAISKELVKSMKGEIGVVSTVDLGSTFWFTFQANEIPEDQVLQIKSTGALTRQFTDKAPVVLLVDDNDINRKVASSILQKSGCEIVEAVDGFEAIEQAANNSFDLVLMDIQMPKMDGLKATEKIRNLKLKHCPPIIAMTAYSMAEDREKYMNAGMDDYLPKPIKAAVLVDMVKSWIDFEPNKIDLSDLSEEQSGLVLNQNTINQLAKFGGFELIETTLQEFHLEAENLINLLFYALGQKDYDQMIGELHTLKGNAGTLGAEKLSKHSETIEKKLKANNFTEIGNDVEVLRLLLNEFKENSQSLIITNE